MSHCAMQQNAFGVAGHREPLVFCPKPRRLVPACLELPLRWHDRNQAEPSDSAPGVQLLDFILPKGGESRPVSPPFFTGSPPARSGNPVVRDVRFGEERSTGPTTAAFLGGGSPMSPRSNGGGCSRGKFDLAPAAVRIEGFDCLDRSGRRRRGIAAVA
ncbi:hypothetical protein AXF42_Ash018131 [Apostasia shenzhenica]|uniref:Uncharacterized protein n=1 Tax=Apostasia shenzhenica TaxID=1088818 RepID=A0A2I0AEZ8_9ASPA|nr:hypothetical protein AXF42_Ash018131 [Apostasia shenzhenica]